MEQSPINQRLKILAERLAGNAHAFGVAIGDKTANTHKYINGNTRPNPEYLEKALLRFGSINARWLLTGEGEPIVGVIDSGVNEPEQIYQSPTQKQKKNKGHIINHTGNGPALYSLEECTRDRDQWRQKCESHEREIVLLQKSIDDKDEIIRLLKSHSPKP